VAVTWFALRRTALSGQPSELTTESLRLAVMNTPHLLMHAGKMLAPVRLNVAPGVDAVGMLVGAAAILVFAMATRRSLPRAILGAAWFLLFLVPTLVVPGLPVYEHRAYLPLIGVVLVAATAMAPRRLGSVFIFIIAAVFATIAFSRQEVFRDAFAYWTDATRDAQFGPIAHVNLGQLYEADNRLADARREYLRALERDPDTPKAHNNVGVVLMKLERADLALMHFREETKRHPWNADAWFNLGLFAEMQGDVSEARRYYQRAIAENRAFRPAYEKLGIAPPGPN
jgi:tetratricopeptide (TPR) repeat protein